MLHKANRGQSNHYARRTLDLNIINRALARMGTKMKRMKMGQDREAMVDRGQSRSWSSSSDMEELTTMRMARTDSRRTMTTRNWS
jgi:hypothetical protein